MQVLQIGMDEALRILAKSRSGRKLAILGDMGELGDLTPAAHRAAGALTTELGLDAVAPFSGAEFDLAQGVFTNEGIAKRIEKSTQGAGASKPSTAFQRLLDAGKRLMTVIQHNEGGANKDLARFASQIQSLCDKWDR